MPDDGSQKTDGRSVADYAPGPGRPPLTIRRILLWVLLSAFVPGLILQGVLHWQRFKTELEREQQVHVEVARAVSLAFRAAIHDMAHEANGIGLVISRFSHEDRKAAGRFLSMLLERYPAAVEISWLDSSGSVIASSAGAGGETHRSIKIPAGLEKERPWALETVEPDRKTGAATFTIVHILQDVESRPRGILAITIDAEQFADERLAISRTSNAGFILFDKNGVAAFRRPFFRFPDWERRDFSKEEYVSAALAGREAGGILSIPMTGKRWFTVRTPVPDLGWVAGAGREYDAVMAPLRRDLFMGLGLSLLCLLFSGGIALYFGREILTDLRRLQDAIRTWGKFEKVADRAALQKVAELEEIAAVFEDMTQRRAEAENALHQSEQRYRSLFEAMSDGFALHEIITDADGTPCDYRFVEVNPAFEQLTGKKREEVIGRRVLEVLPGTESYWIESFGRTALTGEPIRVEEFSRELGRWYEVFAYRTAPGKFAAVFTDVTGRRQALERAAREHWETSLINRILWTFHEASGEELFDRVLGIVQESLHSRHGVFGYIPEPGHLYCPSLTKMLDECEVAGKCIYYPPKKWKGLWARALKEKRAVYTNRPSPVPAGHPPIGNNLAVPILFQGEAIGLLNLANKDGGYTDSDLALAETIADRISPILYAWIQKTLREEERIRAEDELRESENRYRELVQSANSAIIRWRSDGTISFVNEYAQDFFGYHYTEIVGRPVNILVPEKESNGVDLTGLVQDIVDHPEHYRNNVNENICRDGRRAWFSWTNKAIVDAGGRVQEILAIGSDITEARQAQNALRESEKRLRMALDAAFLISFEWDIQTKEVQRPVSRDPALHQTSENEVNTLEDVCQIVHPEDRALFIDRVYAALASEDGQYESEFRIVHPDGQIRWLSERGIVMRDGQGRPERLIGFSQDITERKQAEKAMQESREQIRNSLREKEVLLQEIHHRVKNNMQVISSLVALQAEEMPDAAMRSVIREMSHRIRSMAMVHEKLYQSPDLARVEFAEYIESLLRYLWRAHGASTSGLRLALDLEPVLLPVNQAVPCGLILNELVNNSIRHAFSGRDRGRVAVSLHGGGEIPVRLDVGDDGAGLPEEFDWQQSGSLGLRLVKMLAGQLHAAVEVSNDAGTKFSIIFERLKQ